MNGQHWWQVALSFLGVVVAVWLLVPSFADAVSWLRGVDVPQPRGNVRVSRLLMLVPAHNEELLLGECLRSLKLLQYPRESFRVVVIADNCTDGTAAIARAAGVSCLERTDASKPGKPAAIQWMLGMMDVSDFDAVVIVDADTIVDEHFAHALDRHAPLRDIAVQPFNDVRNPADSALTRMAAVYGAGLFLGSFALKQRARLNVPLSAGMCLGTKVLAVQGWGASSLSEDWEVYARLTAKGVRIAMASAAHLYAQEAASLTQSASQRIRWSAGRLAVLRRVGRAILSSAHIDWHQKVDALSELAAPGPAAQLALVGVLIAALLLTGAPGAAAIAAALIVSLARPAAYGVVGLRADPEPWRAALAFAQLPAYAFWRLLVGVAAVLPSRTRLWTRTAR